MIGYSDKLKIVENPLAAQYFFIAVLIRNSYVCLNGTQVSKRFKRTPPSLVSYFRGE